MSLTRKQIREELEGVLGEAKGMSPAIFNQQDKAQHMLTKQAAPRLNDPPPITIVPEPQPTRPSKSEDPRYKVSVVSPGVIRRR